MFHTCKDTKKTELTQTSKESIQYPASDELYFDLPSEVANNTYGVMKSGQALV